VTVYERLNKLKRGQSVFVDLHETLFDRADYSVNIPLVNALKAAQGRGVVVVLWTGGNWSETVYGVELMRRYELVFDDVIMNVVKGDLIIDNLAVGFLQ